MGKIKDSVREAFTNYEKDFDLFKLVKKIIDIVGYSARYPWQVKKVYDAMYEVEDEWKARKNKE